LSADESFTERTGTRAEPPAPAASTAFTAEAAAKVSLDGSFPEASQRRNSLVFLLNTALAYLVAPVFYIGVLHAVILKSELKTSDTVANLPEALYLWVTPVAVLISWLWPSPRLLRPMLTTALVVNAGGGLLLAGLFLGAPRVVLITAVIVHAGLVGITNGVRQMCLWELLGRGLSPERRARTLGWTFGIGPVFAVLGSCATQLILSGKFEGLVEVEKVPEPWCYVIIFGATGPAMLLAAALVALVHVPPAPEPPPGARIAEIVRGLRQYFLHPLILLAAVAFVLTYGGIMIMTNLALYTREAINADPKDWAGVQLALRFGCKSLSGFALGWWVARVNARASLLATTAFCTLGVCWALLVPGEWYLFSFGLLGAGELFYVYYMNYIVGCSAPRRIRENTAYTNLISVLAGFVPLVFGVVSDRWGLKASFGVAVGLFVAALLIVRLGLPPRPRIEDR
jgi:MFS family permease